MERASTRRIASFANIPVCPNQWASTDVFGNLFDVSLTLQDHDGRMATKDLHVKPVCAEPEKLAECMCICKTRLRTRRRLQR